MFYNVLIHGTKLILKVDETEKLHGFYVNRAVEALNKEEAKAVALEQVQDEVRKKYQSVSIDEVELKVEEITLLSDLKETREKQGFILYLNEPTKKSSWWKFWGND